MKALNVHKIQLPLLFVLSSLLISQATFSQTTNVDIIFEFSEAMSTSDDPRERSVAFHSLTFINTDALPIDEILLGSSEGNELQGDGWYENEESALIGSFQWSGNNSNEAAIQLPVPTGTEGMFLKIRSVKDSLWMNVRIDGELIATLRVDGYWHTGYIPFEEVTPEPMTANEPEWIEGRFFPHFPATEKIFVIPMFSELEIGHVSRATGWRINQSYHDMFGLTLVSMQGLVNRNTPRIYFDWRENSRFWKQELEKHVQVQTLDLDPLSAVNFFMHRYQDRFEGAVVYDPEVPETINLATMIAGLEDRIIMAPEQLDLPGFPEFSSITDLRDLVQDQGWEATIESQTEIYQWVYDNLWPNLEKRILGMISPGPPTSREVVPDIYWPLGMASREYLIALKAPAIYLDPGEEPQKGLLSQFLEDAPSPIPVTGVFSGMELETVQLVSQFGDWVPGNSWPGEILTAANISVLSSVRPEIQKFQTEPNPGKIISTLSDKPVVTMWSSDGDAIHYQMNRGYNFFRWDIVQNQRFGWTINPTLIDLAPVAWNYFMETTTDVGFMCGLSGAGYTYPQLMDTSGFEKYMDVTKNYFEATGLRSVRVDSQGEQYPVDFLSKYDEKLGEMGFLGTIFGWSSPNRGINLEYIGGPSPVVRPTYLLTPSQVNNIAADIHSRIPGKEFIDIENSGNPVCLPVSDEDAFGEQAILIPGSFVSDPSCCMAIGTGSMNLAPGEYSTVFRMKVASNEGDDPLANIYVGVQSNNWTNTAFQTIAPGDFQQAGQYQDLELTFNLDSIVSGFQIRLDYLGGTDLYVDYLLTEREGGLNLPVFAPVFIGLITDEKEGMNLAPGQLTAKIESEGGTVLTPDEFLAALNPEYLIEFATPILGEDHPELIEARQQLTDGEYFYSLLTVREALQPNVTRELRVEPRLGTILLDGKDSVDILIEGVSNSGSYQFDLTYDPNIIEINSVMVGSFPGMTGRSISVNGPNIDNTGGVVSFEIITSGVEDGASGSGVLATVVLTGKEKGVAQFNLENVHVANINDLELPIGELISGSITVNSPMEYWSAQTSGTIQTLNCVSAISDNIAWACGYNGVVLRTTNGGETWINVWSGTPAMNIFTIDGLDEMRAIIYGIEQGRNDATIFSTADGGAEWIQVYDQPNGRLNGLKMFSQNTGVGIGNPVDDKWTILQTTNNGSSWNLINSRPTAIPDEVGFTNGGAWLNENKGWFGTNASRIFQTADGGLTWDDLSTPISNIHTLDFNPTGIGMASNTDGQLIYTMNNGSAWQNINAPVDGIVNQVVEQEGLFFLIMGNSIHSSDNDDISWGLQTEAAASLRFLDLFTDDSGTTGWAVGDNGAILKYTNSELIPIEEEEEKITGLNDDKSSGQFELWQNYPNPLSAETSIKFRLVRRDQVSLKIFDLLGNEIISLADEERPAGIYTMKWDGKNSVGKLVPGGIYLCQLRTKNFIATKKILLVR